MEQLICHSVVDVAQNPPGPVRSKIRSKNTPPIDSCVNITPTTERLNRRSRSASWIQSSIESLVSLPAVTRTLEPCLFSVAVCIDSAVAEL